MIFMKIACLMPKVEAMCLSPEYLGIVLNLFCIYFWYYYTNDGFIYPSELT